MSLSETGVSNASVSLRSLFKSHQPHSVAPALSLEDLASQIVAGGWPGTLGLSASQGARMARNYIDDLRDSDFSSVDSIKRDPRKVQRLLHSLARNVEQPAANKTLIRDMTADANDGPLSIETVDDYLDVLQRVFVLEEITPWAPNLRSPLRINNIRRGHGSHGALLPRRQRP